MEQGELKKVNVETLSYAAHGPEILAMRKAGDSYTVIAEKLTARGVVSITQKPLSNELVSAVMTKNGHRKKKPYIKRDSACYEGPDGRERLKRDEKQLEKKLKAYYAAQGLIEEEPPAAIVVGKLQTTPLIAKPVTVDVAAQAREVIESNMSADTKLALVSKLLGANL